MKDKMDFLNFPEIKSDQIFSLITKGRRVPFNLLSDILVHVPDNFSNHLDFCFEWMIEFIHELIYLRSVIDGCFCSFHFESSFVSAAARSRSNSRSRTFLVSEAACANSLKASLKRPSFARRSPRTLGRR